MARSRSKNAFSGRDRTRVRKLLKALKMVEDMDARRIAKTPAGTTAVLFKKAGSVDHATKITALKTRCNDCLTAKLTVAPKAAAGDAEFGGP